MNTDDKILEDILACADAAARRCFPELSTSSRGKSPYVDATGSPVPLIEVEGTSTAMQRALDPTKTQSSMRTRAATYQLYADKILEVEDYFASSLMDIAQAQVSLATGHQLAIKDPKTGEVVQIYDVSPDSKTGISLLDRILGRPIQRQEITSDSTSQSSVVIMMPDNGRNRNDNARDDRARVNYGPIIDLPQQSPDEEPKPEDKTILFNLPKKNPPPGPPVEVSYTKTFPESGDPAPSSDFYPSYLKVMQRVGAGE
jgi:hypothetical protein